MEHLYDGSCFNRAAAVRCDVRFCDLERPLRSRSNVADAAESWAKRHHCLSLPTSEHSLEHLISAERTDVSARSGLSRNCHQFAKKLIPGGHMSFLGFTTFVARFSLI